MLSPTTAIPRGIHTTWNDKSLKHFWTYKAPDTTVLGHVARYDTIGEKKEVIPFFGRDGDTWKSGGPREPKPLFGLDVISRIVSDSTVYVLEGEKCASALQDLGLPAVSIIGGSGAAAKADWSPLQRFKRVVVVRDNDGPGLKYAKDVADQLAQLPGVPEVFVVLLPGLPDAGDVVEWLKERLPAWDGFGALPLETKDDFRNELIEVIDSVAERVSAAQPKTGSSRIARDWPKPLAEQAFYGLAGQIVRAIEPHTEADPVALFVNFLTAFGSAAGLNSYFVAEADKHYPRLFCTLVGESSKGRKGSSWGHVKRLLETVEPSWQDCLASGMSSGEGLIWAVRDEITKTEPIKRNKTIEGYQDVVIDKGVDDKRLFVLEAELASTLRVMGREGNTLSAIIRAAWDNGDLCTLTKNSPAKATGAHISIVGHITRDELRRYLDSTEAGNGFANRFLWFCVKRSKCLPEGGNISEVDFAPMVKRLAEALKFAQQPREIRRNDEAKEVWAGVYPSLSEGLPGMLGAVTGRAESQVMRVATIYALLDCSAKIELDHLLAALAVWDYAFASARYIFGEALGDPLADEIFAALEGRPEGMTRTDISNLFKRNKNKGQIGRALNMLKVAGKVRSATESTGGAPAERFFLCA